MGYRSLSPSCASTAGVSAVGKHRSRSALLLQPPQPPPYRVEHEWLAADGVDDCFVGHLDEKHVRLGREDGVHIVVCQRQLQSQVLLQALHEVTTQLLLVHGSRFLEHGTACSVKRAKRGQPNAFRQGQTRVTDSRHIIAGCMDVSMHAMVTFA